MTIAAIFVVFPFCLAFAAFSDLFTMTIPNCISAIVLVSFVVISPLAGLDASKACLHVAAAVLVFGACFCLFAVNVMGGGDAKLLTASAIWFGFEASLIDFLLYVSAFGGLLTIAVLLLRSQENLILAARIPVPRLLLTAKKIPYGIAIALGGFAAYPSSPLMKLALTQFS
ncbi:prepilin peptidase [Sinorhizobium medicae]|uniref:A24 family peptidase n=1 Tax=Sinorhizobium medicae TaxID=110321 RepID=UPI000FD770F3|nr:prepilin peptidase [Sinorhizobium medicae]MDX0436841.1 peptidase [Sinorhizobium medicae]MDX0614010.1 peptidase [Sinorhizobium medicae]MDX0652016.1 peptidase [Sinorhizobium medicae]MDX1085967.1 peptidase [Sinorhizobium medicae]MDX1111468.1 peptidase [Sinorhizobium medicae]